MPLLQELTDLNAIERVGAARPAPMSVPSLAAATTPTQKAVVSRFFDPSRHVRTAPVRVGSRVDWLMRLL
ncbi:hypothetical protein ACQP0C_22115 [Nocardia sp. CA-129566]|uniref:hypothetical protein n=1 Tax=Nocardia sp. CA-129566 TaxID=3239976 RepID=UPI003D96DB2F